MVTIRQKAEKVKAIVGFDGKKVVPLDVVCMRKPVPPEEMSAIKYPYFCFTSNWRFEQNPHITPLFWLHCHRTPSFTGPSYLMSESDFVDPVFFPAVTGVKRYDYIYYTCDDSVSGCEYKGFDNFLKILPYLNGMRLRGCILVYVSSLQRDWVIPLTKEQKQLLKSSNIAVLRHRMDPPRLARLMASSNFAIFPNKKDCSPRMIPEGFLNNLPTVMNYDIMGGWKYIEENSNFGSFFYPDKPETIVSACSAVLQLPKNQRVEWNRMHGFERSSKLLANILRQYHPLPKNITHVYFSEFSTVFSRMTKSI
jgi:hypothetical protein